MVRLGSHEWEFPVMLAPMVGFTDLPFRLLCKRHGSDLAFTEVMHATGVALGRLPALFALETNPAEQPVMAHLHSADPARLAEAARYIEASGRHLGLDINTGCPVRSVVRGGAGAALLKSPAKIEALVRAARAATRLPLTVKTRVGWAQGEASPLEIARAAEQGGADAIAIHARFAADRHSGQPHWNLLAGIREKLSIPVIGNGGIKTAADALRMRAETGVAGVMIGRGAIGSPWIFAEIRAALGGGLFAPPGPAEKRQIIAEHLAALIAHLATEKNFRRRVRATPEATATRRFRGHLVQYLRGAPGWSRVRLRMQGLRTPEEVLELVDEALRAPAV